MTDLNIWLGIGTLAASIISILISAVTQNRINGLQTELKRELSRDLIIKPRLLDDIDELRDWAKSGYHLIHLLDHTAIKMQATINIYKRSNPDFVSEDFLSEDFVSDIAKKYRPLYSEFLEWESLFPFYDSYFKYWLKIDTQESTQLHKFFLECVKIKNNEKEDIEKAASFDNVNNSYIALLGKLNEIVDSRFYPQS